MDVVLSAFIPKRSRYLGAFAVDPTPTESGQWWYNTTERNWKFYNGEITSLFGGTYTKTISIPAEEFGRPFTNPPTVVDQGNLTLYAFTLNTDHMTFKFPVPSDYDSGGLSFFVIWTNDGGIDDNGRNVKWQISYQVASEGDSVDGNHANSPKSVEDAYASALGWIEHHTGLRTIAHGDFIGKFCVFLDLSALTPTPPALTCEPHLIGVCFTYTARRQVL